MSAFKLDTSGTVSGDFHVNGYRSWLSWSDLTPRTQGYVEALLRSIGVDRYDLIAPETLARIIEDCAAMEKQTTSQWGDGFSAGKLSWKVREGGWVGFRSAFPPLTVTVGDDGKVYTREAGQ